MKLRGAVGLTLAVVLTSGCALSGRSVRRFVDDKAITGAVKLRLAAQETAHLTRVNVDTFDGVVYLTGEVDTHAQKSDAAIVAWRVNGVRQLINDLQVREAPAASVSASPRPRHPLQDRLHGLARVEPLGPAGPALAYDGAGQVVATVHSVTAQQLVERGIQGLAAADGRPIEHVSIDPVPSRIDRPVPHFHVILWHVSVSRAAALR